MTPQIDYQAAFRSMPAATALLSPDFVILDASAGYLEAAGRTLEEVVGHNILEAFPANPEDPGDTGPQDLRESLEAVLATRDRNFMQLTRYDVEDHSQPGLFEERYWAVVNAPVCRDTGDVAMIVHMAAEVTHQVRQAQAVNA